MVDREEGGAATLLLWASGRRKVVCLWALLFRGSLTGGQECPPSVGQWQEKSGVLGGASLSQLIDWRTGVSALRWRVGGRLIYDLLLLALRFARFARFAAPAYLI